MQADPIQKVQTTKVIGGETANQESAIGAGTDSRWRWWKVLAGVVACVAVFFAVYFVAFGAQRARHWTEDDLKAEFVRKPLSAVGDKFGPPDATENDAAPNRVERLLYRSAVVVKDRPVGTLVTFHGEDGTVVRVTVK